MSAEGRAKKAAQDAARTAVFASIEAYRDGAAGWGGKYNWLSTWLTSHTRARMVALYGEACVKPFEVSDV